MTLSERQVAFVTEYLRDRNPSAAAVRAGYSARHAATLMSTPAIQDEIASRRSSGKAPSIKPDLQALILEAELARRIAMEQNSASGMVAATQLKSRLRGLLDAEPSTDAPAKTPTGITDLALAILAVFREVGESVGGHHRDRRSWREPPARSAS